MWRIKTYEAESFQSQGIPESYRHRGSGWMAVPDFDKPASSVEDRFHRSHEVANLFICDGSSLVSSGRGQPTMTIQALAFRAADHIAEFARRGEI